jgi:serine/threonine protein kinase
VDRTLGRYRIVDELGRGAMGAVYRAVDPMIQREVAIKTLLPNLPEDALIEIRERFLREARSAGRLNHPNIVTIFDVGEESGVAYIAMEMLQGRSLQQMLRDPTPLPIDTAAELAAQVADALDHAHENGIVHRDVKPANVMVAPSGRSKLTDFGVAYVSASTLTQVGTALGSPRYMSPEHVLGVRVDARSDVFSLGSMLYEMLVRRTPFDRPGDRDVMVVLDRIVRQPHVRVREIDPRIPEAFDHILSRALAKKPEHRYQHAREMAADLRGCRPTEIAEEDVFEKTVSLQVLEQPRAPTRKELLMDITDFERRLEREQQERARKADDERVHEENRRREEAAERARMAAVAASRSQPKPEEPRGALAMLKKLAATAPRKDDQRAELAKTQARVAAVMHFAREMRAAAQQLAELAREINSVEPPVGSTYEYPHLGRLPSGSLFEAWSDSRSRSVGGSECCDHILFRYRIRPDAGFSVVLHRDEIARCERHLHDTKAEFRKRVEATNDFGEATRAAFVVRGGLLCEMHLRADYQAFAIAMELKNVRHPGTRQCQIGARELAGLPDEFGRYVLGADDDLEGRIARSARR